MPPNPVAAFRKIRRSGFAGLVPACRRDKRICELGPDGPRRFPTLVLLQAASNTYKVNIRC